MTSAFLSLLILLFGSGVQRSGGESTARIAAPGEPGHRLIVNGQVFDPTGRRPVPGVTVYAYHTDATGVYNRPGVKEPRLRAWVVTDSQGRFQLQTIRPASYPNDGPPAHIHFELSGSGYPRQWGEDLEFSDDPKVTKEKLAASRAKGRFGGVVTPSRGADGILRASIAFRLSERPNR